MDRHLPTSQSGMALVVSLLMVMLTALIGMSVMRVGTTELSLSTASESDRTAFYSADSAVDAAFEALAPEAAQRVGGGQMSSVSVDERAQVVVVVRREGRFPVLGSSLRQFARTAYSIEAESTISGTGASRRVVSGASIRMPLVP